MMELCVNVDFDFSLRYALVQHVKHTFERARARDDDCVALSAKIIDSVCFPVLEQYLSDCNSGNNLSENGGCVSESALFYCEVAVLFRECLPSVRQGHQGRVERACTDLLATLQQCQASEPLSLQTLTSLAEFLNCLLPYSSSDTCTSFVSFVRTLLTQDCASLERFVLRHLVVPLHNVPVSESDAVFTLKDKDRLIGLLLDKHSDDVCTALSAICTLSAQLSYDGAEHTSNLHRLLAVCVEFGVWHTQHSARKISRHILKRVVLRRCELNLPVCCDYVPWSTDCDAAKHWTTVFLLLEVLEEKQVHLIEPVLAKFNQLWLAVPLIATPVVLAVLRRALTHGSSYVTRWAVIKSLRAPCITEGFVCEALIPALNNVSLFLDTDEQQIIFCSQSKSSCVSDSSGIESLPNIDLAPPQTECGRCLVEFFDSFLGGSASHTSSSPCDSNNTAALFAALMKQSWSTAALCHVTHALLCTCSGWSVSAELFQQVCQFVEQQWPAVCERDWESLTCRRLPSAARLLLLSVVASRLLCPARQWLDCAMALCRVASAGSSSSVLEVPLLLAPVRPPAPSTGHLWRYILWSGAGSVWSESEWRCVEAAAVLELHRGRQEPQRRRCLARAVTLLLDQQQSVPLGRRLLDQLAAVTGRTLGWCRSRLQDSSVVTADMSFMAELLSCGVLCGDQLTPVVTESVRWQMRQNCKLTTTSLNLLPFQAGYISALIASGGVLGQAARRVLSRKAFARYLYSSVSVVSSLLFFAALARERVCLLSAIVAVGRMARLVMAAIRCLISSADLERVAVAMEMPVHQLGQICWSAVWCCLVNGRMAERYSLKRQQLLEKQLSWRHFFDNKIGDQLWSMVVRDLTSCQRHDLIHRLWIMSELLADQLSRLRSVSSVHGFCKSITLSCDNEMLRLAWQAVQEQRHSHRSETYQLCFSVFVRLLVVAMAIGVSSSCCGALVENELLPLSESSGCWVLLQLLRQIDDLLSRLRAQDDKEDTACGGGGGESAACRDVYGEHVALTGDVVQSRACDKAAGDAATAPSEGSTGPGAIGAGAASDCSAGSGAFAASDGSAGPGADSACEGSAGSGAISAAAASEGSAGPGSTAVSERSAGPGAGLPPRPLRSALAHRLFLPVAVAAVLHGDVHRRDRRGVDAAHVLAYRVHVYSVSDHLTRPNSGLSVVDTRRGRVLTDREIIHESSRLGDDPMWMDRVVRMAGVRALLWLSRFDRSAFLLAVERLRQTMTSQRKRHFANSLSHRLQLRACQALLVLHARLSERLSAMVYEDCMCLLLTQSLQPSVRRTVQWLSVLICLQQPSCLSRLWQFIDQASSVRSGAIGVFVDIIYHLAAKMSPRDGATTVEFFSQCFSRLLPWTMAQHFSTRLCCQVALSRIWRLAEIRGLTAQLDRFSGVATALNEALARGNSARNAGLLNSDFFYTHFDPVQCFSLSSIYLHMPRLTRVQCDEWTRPDVSEGLFAGGLCDCAGGSGGSGRCCSLRCVPETCCSPGQCPLTLLSPDSQDSGVNEADGMDYEGLQHSSCVSEKAGTVQHSSCASEKAGDRAGTVQRKIAPWRHLAVTDAVEVEMNGVRGRHQSAGATLVASLVERPPNLGGLCRTCEVFGVAQMTVNSLSVVKDSQFTNLSVSAEKWVTIVEVGRHRLPLFLTEQRGRGRCLVALEQTCDSVCLTQCQLPADCVLVLGNEREGIPADLLPLFDVFVEIPQSGVIRSLNVHVAGALLLWEYTRQHGRSSHQQSAALSSS